MRRAESVLALAGLGLLVLGAGLAWWGWGQGLTFAKVLAILDVVTALVVLRARAWIRKTRVLTALGRDLHVEGGVTDDDW